MLKPLNSKSFIVSDVNKLGATIAEHLPGLLKNHVILIDAPMGAGKTTFVSSMAALMGSMLMPSSPTFSICNEYPLASPVNGYHQIVHMDLYRFGSIDEILQSGIEDYLYDVKNLVLIEWPGLIEPIVVEPFTRMTIEVKENHWRKFVYLN